MAMAKTSNLAGSAAQHRQRLRERFLTDAPAGRSDEALLELLLTYAIPQQDVQPLAQLLLERFGSLDGVFDAEMAQLCATPGVKDYSATLIKLVAHLRAMLTGTAMEDQRGPYVPNGQLMLFPAPEEAAMNDDSIGVATLTSAPLSSAPEAEAPVLTRPTPRKPTTPRKPAVAKATPAAQAKATPTPPPSRARTELFSNAAFEDAFKQLPLLPDTASLTEIKAYLIGALRYNGYSTRQRYSEYLTRRMFPTGSADRALRLFARAFAGRRELRDACFYRFCVAEPLLYSITDDVLIPEIGSGLVSREQLRFYLLERNPTAKNIDHTLSAIFKVYGDSQIARVEKTTLRFDYRSIPLAAFAFVLHSEFPAPGIYPLAKLENNRALRALLWSPDRWLPALYDLRNAGIISKVSQIDSVRQFSTIYTVEEVVERLVAEEVGK